MRSACPSPRSRRRPATASRSRSPASRTRRRPRRSSAARRSSCSSTSRAGSLRGSRGRLPAAAPHLRRRRSTTCSSRPRTCRRGAPYQTFYVFDKKTKKKLGSDDTRAGALATVGGKLKPGQVLLSGPGTKPIPGQYLVANCDASIGCPGQTVAGKPGQLLWYMFTLPKDPNQTLLGKEVSSAKQDFDTTTGGPIVLMSFTGKGQKQFKTITEQLAHTGKALAALNPSSPASNFFQHFAIILDGKLESFPLIDFTQNPNGISGDTGAQISGISLGRRGQAHRDRAADGLAADLVRAARPVERLGDARQGRAPPGPDRGPRRPHLVMIYLLVVYRFLGLVADIALIIYAALFYGLIVLIPDHDDAAGHRRHDPDDRCRRRRERRHLRTHQGRGAPRAEPSDRRSARDTRRASTRSSTRTS